MNILHENRYGLGVWSSVNKNRAPVNRNRAPSWNWFFFKFLPSKTTWMSFIACLDVLGLKYFIKGFLRMYLYEKASNLDNLCKLGHISDRKKRQKRATFWSFTAFKWGIYKVFLCWHVESSILKHTVLYDKIYKWNLWFICTQNGRNRPCLRNLEISPKQIVKLSLDVIGQNAVLAKDAMTHMIR